MPPAPLARHLLRARDLVDGRYAEPLDLEALARAAHVSPRHFSRSFRRTFGETPYPDGLISGNHNISLA
jgi:AraC-like DNA-binding protein